MRSYILNRKYFFWKWVILIFLLCLHCIWDTATFQDLLLFNLFVMICCHDSFHQLCSCIPSKSRLMNASYVSPLGFWIILLCISSDKNKAILLNCLRGGSSNLRIALRRSPVDFWPHFSIQYLSQNIAYTVKIVQSESLLACLSQIYYYPFYSYAACQLPER